MSAKRDNINDRESRDEPVCQIRDQLLDAAPTPAEGGKAIPNGSTTGQVPGHLGYNKHDNLINANVTDALDEI